MWFTEVTTVQFVVIDRPLGYLPPSSARRRWIAEGPISTIKLLTNHTRSSMRASIAYLEKNGKPYTDVLSIIPVEERARVLNLTMTNANITWNPLAQINSCCQRNGHTHHVDTEFNKREERDYIAGIPSQGLYHNRVLPDERATATMAST